MPLTWYIVFSLLMSFCVLVASKPGTTGILIKLAAIVHIALSLWTLHQNHDLVKQAHLFAEKLPSVTIEK